MKTLTLSHAGDLGDAMYAGPLLRALAAKHDRLIDLVLYPAPFTRVQHDERSAESILALYRQQPYVGSARFSELPQGNILDGGPAAGWRSLTQYGGMNISAMHLNYFGFNPAEADVPWITPPSPRTAYPVIIHRSARYPGIGFPWTDVLAKYAGKIGMVGGPSEHAAFCDRFGNVPYVKTADATDLANVIAGSSVFVGNQSFPYAVAEAMKANTVQEVHVAHADCIFDRPNASFGVGRWITLPELREDAPAPNETEHAGSAD